MAQYPSSTDANGVSSLKQVRRAIQGGYWPIAGSPFDVDILVVGGGGGSNTRTASAASSGASGAGGYVEVASISNETISGIHVITIGAGGTVSTQSSAGTFNNGEDTSFGSLITAKGGGGGGSYVAGADGGSGGGGGYNDGLGGSAIAATIDSSISAYATSYGNSGGRGPNGASIGGSGGGGAGASGSNGGSGADSRDGAAGGAGKQWLDGNYYAGGGGGARSYNSTVGIAGAGGAGGGGDGAVGSGAGAGTANTGGGAGGTYSTETGANGGSGVVIVRQLATVSPLSVTGSPTVTVVGSYRYYTFTGSGSIRL